VQPLQNSVHFLYISNENTEKRAASAALLVMCLPQQQGLQSWSQPQFMGPQQLPPQPLAP
jgi:hypothetical protein